MIVLLLFTNCKKEPVHRDPIWQEESLSMVSEHCEMVIRCYQEKPMDSGKDPNGFLKSKLSLPECLNQFRTSPVFLLRTKEPESIKIQFRTCFQELKSANCDEFKEKIESQPPSCQKIKEFQNSSFF
jgi:hypothetical protein